MVAVVVVVIFVDVFIAIVVDVAFIEEDVDLVKVCLIWDVDIELDWDFVALIIKNINKLYNFWKFFI